MHLQLRVFGIGDMRGWNVLLLRINRHPGHVDRHLPAPGLPAAGRSNRTVHLALRRHVPAQEKPHYPASAAGIGRHHDPPAATAAVHAVPEPIPVSTATAATDASAAATLWTAELRIPAVPGTGTTGEHGSAG